MRFADHVVLVTGAGSGIGAATARRFADEGATVVLAGRTPEKLTEVADGQERMHVATLDVTDADAVRTLVDRVVAKHGHLDVLVNNAGDGHPGTVTDTTDDDWRHVMAVNLDGVFHASRAALPHLVETRGCIVNLSSVSGLGGDWENVAYNAAKGAVSNLTRAMAMDHAADGVRVNAVAPSLTATPMAQGITSDDDLLARFADRIPMGRAARPEEVASVIAFLASDDAAFVTGVVLPVDGGLGASNGQPRMS